MRTKLREGETLVLECRRHWITLAKAGALCLTGFLLAAAALIYAIISKSSDPLVLILLAVLLVPTVVMGARLYDRYCDLWAVTNQRVIDEEGVFTTIAKESPLEKINNVMARQTLIGRMLGYGDVIIQTAAEDGATVYKHVTDPELLKDTITRCQQEYRRGASADPAVASGPTKTCPFCAETIKAQAKVCRYCGRELPDGGQVSAVGNQ